MGHHKKREEPAQKAPDDHHNDKTAIALIPLVTTKERWSLAVDILRGNELVSISFFVIILIISELSDTTRHINFKESWRVKRIPMRRFILSSPSLHVLAPTTKAR